MYGARALSHPRLLATAAVLALGVLLAGPPAFAGGAGQPAAAQQGDSLSLEMYAGGKGIRMTGRIDHGATRRLETLLSGNAGVRYLELESSGGYVAEARGLVRLVRSYRLVTYVRGDCLSACTLAFASGSTRHLAPGARLGFHRYRLASPLMPLFMNAEQEQRKDMEILRRRDVPQAFIERIDATPPEAMWFPSHGELIAARMVDRIGPPD